MAFRPFDNKFSVLSCALAIFKQKIKLNNIKSRYKRIETMISSVELQT